MKPSPFNPPRVVEEENERRQAQRIRREQRGRTPSLIPDMAGIVCGVLSLLMMYIAYARQMYPPPGWFMGDPELYWMTIVVAPIGILFSCFAHWKWFPLALNLIATTMAAATLVAEIFFDTHFPPQIR